MTETAKERQETMDEELARLVYEELIVEFPGYKAVPEPMAKALIRLGVNNGIRFSASTTDKLSVEKLQEQLNTAKKALTEIRADIEEHNQIYDLDANTALLLEGIDGIAFDALAAIGNEGSGDE